MSEKAIRTHKISPAKPQTNNTIIVTSTATIVDHRRHPLRMYYNKTTQYKTSNYKFTLSATNRPVAKTKTPRATQKLANFTISSFRSKFLAQKRTTYHTCRKLPETIAKRISFPTTMAPKATFGFIS